jgi:hypothetical protein
MMGTPLSGDPYKPLPLPCLSAVDVLVWENREGKCEARVETTLITEEGMRPIVFPIPAQETRMDVFRRVHRGLNNILAAERSIGVRIEK